MEEQGGDEFFSITGGLGGGRRLRGTGSTSRSAQDNFEEKMKKRREERAKATWQRKCYEFFI